MSTKSNPSCKHSILSMTAFLGIITQTRLSRLGFKGQLKSPPKMRNFFGVEDALPKTLRSHVVYKFLCAGCNACYVGEINWHLAAPIREHLFTDKNSHIFQHLEISEICQAFFACFSILYMTLLPHHFNSKSRRRFP